MEDRKYRHVVDIIINDIFSSLEVANNPGIEITVKYNPVCLSNETVNINLKTIIPILYEALAIGISKTCSTTAEALELSRQLGNKLQDTVSIQIASGATLNFGQGLIQS